MIATVQIRLVADNEADALSAIAALRDSVGTARVALSSPHEGRRGQWLSYGTLQVEPLTVTASGPTQRLAATGKTT